MDIVDKLEGCDVEGVGPDVAEDAAYEIKKLRMALDTLVSVVGLTAIKHESQREVLQEAVDLAINVLRPNV